MPGRARSENDRQVNLLELLLVIDLYRMGATQDKIARTVGRQKQWVNQVLKGLPKKGGANDK